LFLRDFDGIVLHSAIKGIEVVEETVDGDVLVRCGSGETWDEVVKEFVSRDWYGAENMSLIPGEVGATAVQNIGAYGVEVKDIISEVETFDLSTGEARTFTQTECLYGYRDSRFKHYGKGSLVVTNVTYRLSKTFRPILDYGNIRSLFSDEQLSKLTAKQLREAIIATRKAKLPDPKVLGSAGSFFKNPIVPTAEYERIKAQHPTVPHFAVSLTQVKIPAGWLIEQCGWKGVVRGRAAVHDKQALVLVNKGGATGQEIYDLAEAIRADVQCKFGVDIQPEVNIIG